MPRLLRGLPAPPAPPTAPRTSRPRSSRRSAAESSTTSPGAGKPLEGLGDHHDPDWWIRRKIQTEQLHGLGPPALMLRVEHAEFEERVDALAREDDVREYVEDFNRRVVEARRQLLGGPPVVTPTRDVDAEAAAWRTRRAERRDAEAAARAADEASGSRRRRKRRRG